MGQISEGWRIVQSPVAGMNVMQRMVNLLDLTAWWDDPVASGRFKGWNKGLKNTVNVLPFHNTVYRFTHPAEAIKFFNMR